LVAWLSGNALVSINVVTLRLSRQYHSVHSTRCAQQCGAIKTVEFINRYLLLVIFETDDNYSV